MHRVERSSPVEESEVRAKVYAVLREYAETDSRKPFLMRKLFVRVVDKLIKANVVERPKFLPNSVSLESKFENTPTKVPFPYCGIPERMANLVRQIFWELFIQGILAPSTSENQLAKVVEKHITKQATPLSFPTFHDYWISFDEVMLTPLGVSILTDTQNRIQVHDPDGYLQNFWGATPSPDTEMMRYLSEGIAVFRNVHLHASVILLGVASERLIDVFAEKLREALNKKQLDGDMWFNQTYKNKREISARFQAVEGKLMKEFSSELRKVDLEDPFQQVVTLTFQQLRTARNSIAHPNGRVFTWNEVSGFFHNFVQYFIYINQIIAVLREIK